MKSTASCRAGNIFIFPENSPTIYLGYDASRKLDAYPDLFKFLLDGMYDRVIFLSFWIQPQTTFMKSCRFDLPDNRRGIFVKGICPDRE